MQILKKIQFSIFIDNRLMFSLHVDYLKKKHSIQNLFIWKVFTLTKLYAVY